MPAGLFLANLAVLAFSQMSGDAFVTWGWRIPFLLSIVLVGIGLWIRLGITETPLFRQLVAKNRIERTPFLEVIRKHPKEIILSALARMSEQAPFYIFVTFIFAYGTTTLHASRDLLLLAVLVAACVSFVTVPLSGHISDLIGRKKIVHPRRCGDGPVRLRLFPGMLNTGSSTWIFLSRSCSRSFRTDMQYGPQAALIAENFTGRLRYSGASMGYQLASIIARRTSAAHRRPGSIAALYQSGTAIALYILFQRGRVDHYDRYDERI